MKKYQIYQVDAFTTEMFSGNPAGVVSHADGLSDEMMQAIAREINNSETAFIFSANASDHDVRIRFFTPSTEVPSCGHATIAAHFVRAYEDRLSPCTIKQKIGIGILPVEIMKDNEGYRIVMTQGDIVFSESIEGDMKDRILSALDLSISDMDTRCPVQIVSTGHSKVMVGISSQKKLHVLKPDMGRLCEISSLVGSNGFFVFTLDADSDTIRTHGRMFAPAIGIPEDPVTGNANGPLGAYLVRHRLIDTSKPVVSFSGQQGEAIGRTGIVDVMVDVEKNQPVRVRVGGRAVIVFKTEIEL